MKYFKMQNDGTYKWEEKNKQKPVFTPSQTDKNDFIKDVKGSKSLILGGGTQYIGVYDFPDGKDTGLDLTMLRQKGIDITEIEEAQRNLTNKAIQNIQEVNDEMEKIKLEQAIEAQNQVQNQNPTPNSQ